MADLKPFFTYYGGKYRAAPRYPQPLHQTIVEPFAGSAGYSLRHYRRQVVLIEKDPTVAELWRFLIGAKAKDFLALPDIQATLDDHDLEPGEKALIGFWLNKGTASPCKSPSAWMRSGIRPNSYWGNAVRHRLAKQAGAISHWTVIEGDYTQAPSINATWFIDPPYQKAGLLYRQSSKNIDFGCLAEWTKARTGQVMVCENAGADWLPFQAFSTIKSTPGKRGKSYSQEVIWNN